MSSSVNSTVRLLRAGDAPLPARGRSLPPIHRAVLAAAMILPGLLTVASLTGCAATQPAAPLETGEIDPGGRLGSAGTGDGGNAWSLVVGDTNIDIRVGDSSVVLQGFGTQQRVLYTHRHSTPPQYTFSSEGRPEVWWRGYTLKIGAAVHDLSESGSYVVLPDGALRSE